MLRNIMLSGTLSHAFAAIMTATVVLFPTPRDLWDTITDQAPVASDVSLVNGGVSRLFPTDLDEQTPLTELTAALELCVEDQAGAIPIYSRECGRIMSLAAQRIAAQPENPDLAHTERKLKLAITFYCRQQWAAAQTGRTSFDTLRCQSELPMLAEDT